MKLSERAFLLGSLTHQEAAGDGMRFSNSLPLSLCTPSSTNIVAWYLLYALRLLYLHISPFLSHTVDFCIVDSSEIGLGVLDCSSTIQYSQYIWTQQALSHRFTWPVVFVFRLISSWVLKCLVLNGMHVPTPSYRRLRTVFHSLNCDVWLILDILTVTNKEVTLVRFWLLRFCLIFASRTCETARLLRTPGNWSNLCYFWKLVLLFWSENWLRFVCSWRRINAKEPCE